MYFYSQPSANKQILEVVPDSLWWDMKWSTMELDTRSFWKQKECYTVRISFCIESFMYYNLEQRRMHNNLLSFLTSGTPKPNLIHRQYSVRRKKSKMLNLFYWYSIFYTFVTQPASLISVSQALLSMLISWEDTVVVDVLMFCLHFEDGTLTPNF